MAIKQWNARRQREAKAALNDIAFEYPDTDAADASLTNLKKVLQDHGQIPGDIVECMSILNKRRPVLLETDILHQNYWPAPCYELSKIYEQLGDLLLAEMHARQAVENDEIHEWCGV